MDEVTPAVRQAPRSPADRLERQIVGVQKWQEFLRTAEQTREVVGRTREERMDAGRRRDALRRANEAVRARADANVEESVALLQRSVPRAVVAHRQDWFRHKLALGLDDYGVQVLGELEDAAVLLGTAIAEQPELVVVEDRLPSMQVPELVASLRQFVPGALVAAQVERSDSVGRLLDAGARAVFARRVPPTVVAEQVARLLGDDRAEPLVLT